MSTNTAAITFTRYAIRRTGTPHYGVADVTGAPRLLCNTTSTELEALSATEAVARMCQQCDRAHAVVEAGNVEPELRLVAGAQGKSGAGHRLIPGQSRGYCGKELGEDTPTGARECKNCASMLAYLDRFLAAVQAQPGSDAEAEAEPTFDDYVDALTEAVNAAPTLADVVEIEQPAPTAGEDDDTDTWRGQWLTASTNPGQQLTLDGVRPDAQQGALFA